MTAIHSSVILPAFKTNLKDGLRSLGESANGVATGIWKAEGTSLKQQDVWFADSVPQDVQVGFQEATQNVPLSQDGLAIVKAFLQGKPIFTHAETSAPSENSSPSWLRKFGAKMSLAVPILRDNKPIGVLAMSSRDAYTETDSRYALMTEISENV